MPVAIEGPTYQPDIVLFFVQHAAEVRTAPDIVPPELNWARPSKIRETRSAIPADAGADTVLPSTAVPSSQLDFWLRNSLEAIHAARASAEDDMALRRLDTAEVLAVWLSDIPSDRRPQLAISDEGEPVFATSIDGLYINITVDAPETLTWYALVKEQEFFSEGVAFNGRDLPSELRCIFEV